MLFVKNNFIFQLGVSLLLCLAIPEIGSWGEGWGGMDWGLESEQRVALPSIKVLDTLPAQNGSLHHLMVPSRPPRRDLQAQVHLFKGAEYFTYIVDPRNTDIALFYDNEKRQKYGTIANLKAEVEQQAKELLFATNGGIFHPDRSPLGLFIEDGRQRKGVNLKRGKGNFFLHPNGVFYINEWGYPNILESLEFMNKFGENPKHVKYAVQSGPLLLNKDRINHKFTPNSVNRKIRSGVGWSVIDPNSGIGKMVFVLSASPVNFYDFALFFQKQLNCTRALYLDGEISEMYLPELKLNSTRNRFAVIIGVTNKIHK